jgi:tellurite resistance protein TerC
MYVPLWVWAVTIAGLAAVFAVDLLLSKPHRVSMGEAGLRVLGYALAAIGFGVGVWLIAGARHGGEFFAGWITEYSLSVDNLFVFVIIMSRFAVPAIYAERVLLVGVVLALVARGVFIAAGAVLIARFSWVFYVFGAFLVYTAVNLLRHRGQQGEFRENTLLRLLHRVVPTTADYHGSRLLVRVDGRRFITPMLVVMVAIGSTDVLFALDSIPAIFGLTRVPYLVFAANAFALLGLRELYFLLGGLLTRLRHLSVGLAAILAFIGVKQIFEALHGSGVDHVGPVPVPHIGTPVSLAVIVLVLAVTTVTSLLPRADAPPASGAESDREQDPRDSAR